MRWTLHQLGNNVRCEILHKPDFAQKFVEYLCHHIYDGKLIADPTKVAAIAK